MCTDKLTGDEDQEIGVTLAQSYNSAHGDNRRMAGKKIARAHSHDKWRRHLLGLPALFCVTTRVAPPSGSPGMPPKYPEVTNSARIAPGDACKQRTQCERCGTHQRQGPIATQRACKLVRSALCERQQSTRYPCEYVSNLSAVRCVVV